MRLKDKVCFVTVGGSGMGRVAAAMFCREGARVAVADVTLYNNAGITSNYF